MRCHYLIVQKIRNFQLTPFSDYQEALKTICACCLSYELCFNFFFALAGHKASSLLL